MAFFGWPLSLRTFGDLRITRVSSLLVPAVGNLCRAACDTRLAYTGKQKRYGLDNGTDILRIVGSSRFNPNVSHPIPCA